MRGQFLRRLLLAGLVGMTVTVAVPAGPAAADQVRDRQWQLGFLLARQAWQYSTGAGVTVAVIDSGVDATHPDLRGQVLPGADFVDASTDGRSDPVGHGTTVAALIAGRGDDSRGVVGLAPRAKILPVRVLDAQNQYESAAQVARALRWAVDRGAKVVNISLGSAESSKTLNEALFYAFQHDVVVVACNGNLSNNRGSQVWHPAREPGVLAVSGVARSRTFWSGSLQGPETVLSAPSADIMGAYPGGSYWRVQGTSFAAPLVAATAALIRARFPQMNAANVINRLVRTAWDFGPSGRDAQYGFGIVNPTKALTATVPTVTSNPLLRPRANNWGGIAPGGPESPGDPDAVDGRSPRSAEPLLPPATLTLIALACVGLVMGGVGATVLLAVGRRRRTLAPAGGAVPVSPATSPWSVDWSARRAETRFRDRYRLPPEAPPAGGRRPPEPDAGPPPPRREPVPSSREPRSSGREVVPPSHDPTRPLREPVRSRREPVPSEGAPTGGDTSPAGRVRGVARIPESTTRTAWNDLGRYRLDQPPGPDYPY